MRKGIKILGYVLSSVVLVTIIIPLTLSLLINIRSVQNWLVDRLAEMASRKLGTVVRVDHVDLGLFNRLQVDGFYVEDLQGDTLLYVGHAETGIASFRPLALGKATVDSCVLRLAQTPEGEMNIKQVVDRMRGKGEGNFRLFINHAEVTDFSFILSRRDREPRSEGIDFANLRIYDADIDGRDLSIVGDSIALRVDAMSFRERSGFRLDDMSADPLSVVGGKLRFDNLHLASGATDLNIPQLALEGASWDDFSEFVDRVPMTLRADNSSLDLATVGYFAPSLAGKNILLSGFDLDVSGPVSAMKGALSHARVGARGDVDMTFSISGLPDIDRTRFDMDLHRFSIDAADLRTLLPELTGKPLDDKTTEMIGRARTLNASGQFNGLLSAFDASVLLKTHQGAVNGRFSLHYAEANGRRFNGMVTTRGFNCGELLGNDKLGRITMTAFMTGHAAKGKLTANVDGRIPHLYFNGYHYDSVRLNGRFDNRRFEGYAGCADNNLDFDFNGSVDFNDEVPRYDFDLELKRADLHALNFNRRDTVSILSASVAARASGRSIDDMNGTVDVNGVRYISPEDTVSVGGISLIGENTAGNKFISLSSDIVEATFRSRLSYRTILEYIEEGLFSYLPSLNDDTGHVHQHMTDEAGSIDRYSLLSVNFKHTDGVTQAIMPGLQIADGTTLSFMFNPDNDRFTLKLLSDYIERNHMMATKINLNANNSYDSLALYLRAEDLYVKSFHMPNLSVQAGAKENRISLSSGFNDKQNNMSALIGANAVLRRDEEGRRSVMVRMRPSNIRRNNKVWYITSRGIDYSPDRIEVDSFAIRHGQQELLLDGVASRDRNDSIVLSMHNFDLTPLGQAIANMGYEFSGQGSGRAVMSSALQEGRIDGNIFLDSIKINQTLLPQLQLLARWDIQQNRARLFMANSEKADTVIRGYYAPLAKRYYIMAQLDSIPMSLLDPVLEGVMSNTTGTANASLELTGRGSAAQLKGTIDVDSLSSKVDYTQVAYSIPKAHLEVRDNRLQLSPTRFYDRDGNSGLLDIDLNFNSLSNMSFAVTAKPERMLVMNTTQADNDLFYGTVYGSGEARIRGDKLGVRMNISATTDNNTQFFLPLSGSTDIVQADFVVFTNPKRVHVDTANYLVRKKMMYERRHRRKVSGGSNTDISLSLNVRPNAEFQLVIDPTVGDVMRGRGQGTLNIHINPRSGVFDMYGNYDITEGSYQFTLQNIVSKKFIIDEGSSIQWTGEPLDAILNVRAIYRIKTSLQPLLGNDASTGAMRSSVDCIINLTDRLSKPTVTFDIEIPNADADVQNVVHNLLSTQEEIANQFIYLLIFNSFVGESNTAGSVNFGAVGTATTGMELLSNQLSNWLSSDDYNIVIRYRPKSETSGDEFDFGFSSSLISDRLILEVEGNYVTDNTTINGQSNNLMGEAYVTWLIDRGGNLRLKGFTQTIDRFDENQGLQESGIGIYYKEDFNTFRDIIRNFKERFANFGKRKRAKKAAREQAALEKAAAEAASVDGTEVESQDTDSGSESGESGESSERGAAVPKPIGVQPSPVDEQPVEEE